MRRSTLFLSVLVQVFLVACLMTALSFSGSVIDEINPDYSTQYDGGSHSGASGGRVNNLAAAPGSGMVYYAATEWGGLYKTEDRGVTWNHLDNHIPPVTWDVAVDPSDANTVYATSLYDGRISPISGIEVSRDQGLTWFHPHSSDPPVGLDCVDPNGDFQVAPREWSGFGIAVQPDAPQNVFVGTTCGVIVSHDAGTTWTFVDPDPNTPGRSYVWDVAARPGGSMGSAIVDVCGLGFHSRSTDGGQTWEQHDLPYPDFGTGRCSLAQSPDEPYVVFVVDDITDQVAAQPNDFKHMVWESDDGGRSWIRLGKPYPYQTGEHTKRLTFLEANDRADNSLTLNFDLWYGEQDLWRIDCQTPIPASEPLSTSDQTIRCPKAFDSGGHLTWSGPPFGKTEEDLGAHGDSGDVVFDPTQSLDACPVIYASDGGVFYNKDKTSPACQDPNFDQPDKSPHALWLLGMAGSNLSGGAVALHFGVQDDGSWAAPDAAGTPAWTDGTTADSFSRVADPNRYLWIDQDGLHLATPGTLTGSLVTPPIEMDSNGATFYRKAPDFGFFPKIDEYGDKKYIFLTDNQCVEGNSLVPCPDPRRKIYITDDITVNPPMWSDLTGNLPDAGYCGVRAAVDPSNGGQPVFFAIQGEDCNDNLRGAQDVVYKHPGTSSSTSWEPLMVSKSTPAETGVFAVDPTDARRIYISYHCGGPCVGMIYSNDGGTSWTEDAGLIDMMKGRGLITPGKDTFLMRNSRGADGVYGFRSFYFIGYAQPSLVAFDPDDPNILVAGGKDSGVFLTTDGGKDWGLVTDPLTPDPNHPHISQPWFAHFGPDSTGATAVYIGTRGRGVWRIAIHPPAADIGGPYTTSEGTDVTLDASGSTDPDGQTLSFAWDLDGDGVYETPGGSSIAFDDVGQDGVFQVGVKVTAGGVSSYASTTVTVNNVAPSVSLSSNAPKDENSAVALTGLVSDPGWLDPLTATIDWGDGTALMPVSGTYEGVRPDATLAFTASHVYGDNGTFTATVCAMDDDTTTCQSIALQIDNVPPTAAIDPNGTVPVNGVPTFITHAGQPVDFSGRSTDPGSDDLYLSWDWDDGPPSPDVTTEYLVNPPNPDPFPSPSIQPRDVTEAMTHVFGQACFYDISFASVDDDGGSASDDAAVVITGNASGMRSAGYWQHQITGGGSLDFDPATLQCYLDIAGYMSQVFNEVRSASTPAEAAIVLQDDKAAADMRDALDREILAAWLNFANGAIDLGTLVNVDKDKALDETFAEAMTTAEAVRLDPNATREALEEQKDILDGINTAKK